MNWNILECLISLLNDWKQVIEQRNRSISDNYHQNNYEILMLPSGNNRVTEIMTNLHLFYWKKEFKILILLLWTLGCGIWLLSINKFQDMCGVTTFQFFAFFYNRINLFFSFNISFPMSIYSQWFCIPTILFISRAYFNYPSLTFSFSVLKTMVFITTCT